MKGKTVLLGVTGSIAAYKTANLASMLVKQGCDVHVLMTKNAAHFINPITFETLTSNKCLIDTFDRNFQYNVEHVALAKRADAVMIAPASANVIAKLAHGICDDMLTTTVLACTCKKMVSPAMNTNMFQNPITQDNLQLLIKYGFEVIEPAVGRLACNDVGAGKMPSEETLFSYIEREISHEKDMDGLKVLVTAGATCEAIDPVRYITNHSSGKMGYALAKNCMLRGAEVTLITGNASVAPPPFVKVIQTVRAKEMFEAVKDHYSGQDIILKAAAVADFRPKNAAQEKIKKAGASMEILLEKTDDILQWLGENRKPGQYICGFSMETEKLVENSRLKLEKKKLDMIAANNLKVEGAGFQGDTNVVTLITEAEEHALQLMSKEETAEKLLDFLLCQREKKI